METLSESKRKLRADLLKEIYFAGFTSAGAGATTTTTTLSENLKRNLEQLDMKERKEIVSRLGIGKQERLSPFFIACRQGNLEIVEYLIETCGADMEQKGRYDICFTGTPLCCAAEGGKLEVVKCLVEHGANVNAISDNGSTPVLRACVYRRHEVVRYLVEHAGVDLNRPNYDGLTCLMKSVRSPSLCHYLLVQGADVNAQDNKLRTAFHHAFQEYSFDTIDTIKVLITHGADPFLRNRRGDDAFQTGCIKAGGKIFSPFLLSVFSEKLSRERQAELYELMGAMSLDWFDDYEMALDYWEKAIELRSNFRYDYNPAHERPGLPKKALGYTPSYAIVLNRQGIYEKVSEFNTKEELEVIAADSELMRVNCLLITERILGPCHKNTIFMIQSRGREYAWADSSQYRKSILLWQHALCLLRMQKNSLLVRDTCYLVLDMIRLCHRLDVEAANHPIKVSDLMNTFKLLVDELPECVQLVKVRPVFREQQLSFDGCLWCCLHLLYLILRDPNKTKDESLQLRKITEKLVGYRQNIGGNSLLHLAVIKANIFLFKSCSFRLDPQISGLFPSADVTKYLIECGANVNALNAGHATPLHLAVSQENLNSTIIGLLLENGAHLDSLNRRNQSPLALLQGKNQLEALSLLPLEHISLKCMAAGAMGRYGVSCDNLPEQLREFVEVHRPTYAKEGN